MKSFHTNKGRINSNEINTKKRNNTIIKGSELPELLTKIT